MLTMDDFSCSTANRGDEVSREVYEWFLNILPPINLKGGQGWPAGFQVGEPYCHRTDVRTDRWRAMYHTFTSSNGRYYFQGVNFAGEVDSRQFVDKE